MTKSWTETWGTIDWRKYIQGPDKVDVSQLREKVRALIENGANINDWEDNSTDTPLIKAVSACDFETVKMIVEAGADRNKQNRTDYSPILCATYHLCMPSFRNKDKVEKIFNYLLECGVDVNTSKRDGVTPLMVVAREGLLEYVEKLVDAGADINAKTKDDETALMKASYTKNTDLIRFLLEHDADVNARAKDGTTALSTASYYSVLPIVELLVQAGADVNAKNNQRYTPFMSASQAFKTDIMDYLLENDADIDAKNGFGYTALMMAVKHDKADRVAYLLEKGADTSVQALNRRGEKFTVDNLVKSVVVRDLLSRANAKKVAQSNAKNSMQFHMLPHQLER